MAKTDEPKKVDGFDKWEVESMARTLREAHEIMCDDKKFKAAKKELKRQKEEFKSVDDLIAYRNEKYGSKAEVE